MANKNLFRSLMGKLVPATDALNEEKAPAYALSPKHALAQYVATGCMNATFYASAEDQLTKVLELCSQVEPEFVARTAVFCRERGFMKDMPALLCAILSVRDRELLAATFSRVIDNGKMLRNFVQIMRSGVVGRKSLGSAPKRLIREWLEAREDDAVFTASIGQSPSLADIVKMVHPTPRSKSREALYGYFIGREHEVEALPEIVRDFEKFKGGERSELPHVPFQMLTALDLGQAEWTAIARRAPWQMTRMNLNTFARHGVFEEAGMAELIAERLRDPQAIRKARVFPYQLMTAFTMTDERVPAIVRESLQDAMEIALANVPQVEGKVYVCPDISGSMHSPVTGYRRGATTAVRCIDVAALVAASILRKNPRAEVIPFESKVVQVRLNARDSVMTNAEKLAGLPCGGTNCSAPLAFLNKREAKGDLIVYVSDNESWVDAPNYGYFGGSRTETMNQWARFRARNPQARMVCLDLQPYGTTQAKEREDILNIGGFSDQVFDVIAEFAAGRLNANHWIGVIESVVL
ncbi:MAG TPA: RNA-binding protein [Blastocatellia bacterium]|jgi:60 kDa SS-A/Ro ribonucleoprotein|nr:RNA-binding protein [Blastocatellia bacterium]